LHPQLKLLWKRLCQADKTFKDACVAEDGGEVRYFAEYSDYKNFDWWKTALENLPISFLEIPVSDLVKDEEKVDGSLFFSPQVIVKHYGLNPNNDPDTEIAALQWVQDKVINTLNPLLAPNFKVVFHEVRFRLIPETREASLTDQEQYNKIKSVILSALPTLQRDYNRMSLTQNSKVLRTF